jgi:hypothetical protein
MLIKPKAKPLKTCKMYVAQSSLLQLYKRAKLHGIMLSQPVSQAVILSVSVLVSLSISDICGICILSKPSVDYIPQPCCAYYYLFHTHCSTLSVPQSLFHTICSTLCSTMLCVLHVQGRYSSRENRLVVGVFCEITAGKQLAPEQMLYLRVKHRAWNPKSTFFF